MKRVKIGIMMLLLSSLLSMRLFAADTIKITAGQITFPDNSTLSTGTAEFEYFSILAETMRPIDSTIEFDCNDGTLKTISDSTQNYSSQYIAQVNLTDGSKIVSVTAYGFDNDANDFSFALYRYRFNGVGQNVFEQVTETGYSGTVLSGGVIEITSSTVDPVDPPGLIYVNNQNYSYGLYLELPKPNSNELYLVRFCVKTELKQ